MPPRRRACLAIALAGQMATSPALAAPAGDFEQALADADAHAVAGEHRQALEDYETAFGTMPPELRHTEVGELVVMAAGKAGLADFEARGEVESLARAKALLESFVQGVADDDAATVSPEAAAARLQEIEAAIPEPDDAEPAPPPPPGVTGSSADPGPTDGSPTDTRARPPIGPILVGVGGACIVGGVATIVAGSRQVPWFRAKMDEIGWTEDHPDFDDEAARAIRQRNIDIGVGVAVAVVGLGLAIPGAVLMARGKKEPEPGAVAWSVSPVRGGAQVGATLRF